MTSSYTVVNKGVPGNTSGDLVKRVEADVVALKPDVAIVLCGTNDMVNSRKFLSYDAFATNLRVLIETMQAAGIIVVLMSPPPVDTAYLFQRHEKALFPELPNVRLDSASAIIANLAREYQAYYIDLHETFKMHNTPSRDASSLLINEKNLGKADGVHPTSEGYCLIASQVYQLLKEEGLLRKGRSIVCFGDSMTFGTYLKGAGTAKGDTYPAFLKGMMLGSQVACRKH